MKVLQQFTIIDEARGEKIVARIPPSAKKSWARMHGNPPKPRRKASDSLAKISSTGKLKKLGDKKSAKRPKSAKKKDVKSGKAAKSSKSGKGSKTKKPKGRSSIKNQEAQRKV